MKYYSKNTHIMHVIGKVPFLADNPEGRGNCCFDKLLHTGNNIKNARIA